MTPREQALLELGRWLSSRDYAFITPTPETHRRVNSRAASQQAAADDVLRDVFGWSRPFERSFLPSEVLALLEAAGELAAHGDKLRATVRFSRLNELLLVHSAYPTNDNQSVFFGPDTYRFCRLLAQWAPAAERAVDIGCGSGAGGLCVHTRVRSLVLCDINPRALSFSRVNAALCGAAAQICESDVLNQVTDEFDLIVANPPYMRDATARVYRDGGGSHGEGLSVRIVRESLPRLRPGGTLIVYTGAAVVKGRDCFRAAIEPLLAQRGVPFDYEELDPDVFGEELDQPSYEDVDRIAAVGLRVHMPVRT